MAVGQVVAVGRWRRLRTKGGEGSERQGGVDNRARVWQSGSPQLGEHWDAVIDLDGSALPLEGIVWGSETRCGALACTPRVLVGGG
jgi:hypothetical protein